MATFQNNGLKFIRPDWSAPDNVTALVTTRIGGVSKGHYDSLNVAAHVEDSMDVVNENRERLINAANLPSEPVWLDQVHGTDIVELDESIPSPPIAADGAMTSKQGVVCAVMTADCLPLFLTSKDGRSVGVIHAGWRGLADGIVEKAVLALNDSPDNVIAWAGPCISNQHFEIGAEVREQLDGMDSAYTASENSGKYYADLYQLVGERLKNSGVSQYSHSEYCTFRDKDLFYSYRRDKVAGRFVSLIWRG